MRGLAGVSHPHPPRPGPRTLLRASPSPGLGEGGLAESSPPGGGGGRWLGAGTGREAGSASRPGLSPDPKARDRCTLMAPQDDEAPTPGAERQRAADCSHHDPRQTRHRQQAISESDNAGPRESPWGPTAPLVHALATGGLRTAPPPPGKLARPPPPAACPQWHLLPSPALGQRAALGPSGTTGGEDVARGQWPAGAPSAPPAASGAPQNLPCYQPTVPRSHAGDVNGV